MFYGSCSFTRWKEKYGNGNLEDMVRHKDGSKACINHGFGSATAETMLYYYDRLVRPWKPRVLVLKTGGNDCKFQYTPDETVFLLSRIIEYARIDCPNIKFFLSDYNNLNPINEYKANWLKDYNNLLEIYCSLQNDCVFAPYSNSLFFYEDKEKIGKSEFMNKKLYILDGHHLNARGYKACAKFWTQTLEEYL